MSCYLSAKSYFRAFFSQWRKRWPAQGQFIFIRLSKDEYRLFFFDEHPDLVEMLPRELVFEAKGYGAILKAWRLSKKLSLAELGDITGMDPSNICAMEHGRRSIGRKSAERIETLVKVVDINTVREERALKKEAEKVA